MGDTTARDSTRSPDGEAAEVGGEEEEHEEEEDAEEEAEEEEEEEEEEDPDADLRGVEGAEMRVSPTLAARAMCGECSELGATTGCGGGEAIPAATSPGVAVSIDSAAITQRGCINNALSTTKTEG